MAYITLYILFALAMVTPHVVLVDSCSCRRPDPYTEICGSDFAINATVLSENITYPEVGNNDPWDIYTIHYELDIHDVFTPSIDDVASLPTILESYGPSSLCGLSLEVNATYILAGYLYTDKNTGNQVLGMVLCNLVIYVNGQWGSSHNYTEELLSNIDCSNPPIIPGFSFLPRSLDSSKVRSARKQDKKTSDQVVKAPRSGEEAVSFRKFLAGINRRDLKNGMESFFSTFSRKATEKRNGAIRF